MTIFLPLGEIVVTLPMNKFVPTTIINSSDKINNQIIIPEYSYGII